VNSNTLLGYATFPTLSNLTGIPQELTGSNANDGFWCYSKRFGSKLFSPVEIILQDMKGANINTLKLGTTLVYAILEAMEIIMLTGDCSATDYCDDTPPQLGGFNPDNMRQNFGSAILSLYALGLTHVHQLLMGVCS